KRVQRVLLLTGFRPGVHLSKGKPASIKIHGAGRNEVFPRALVCHDRFEIRIKNRRLETLQSAFQSFSTCQSEMGSVLESLITRTLELLKGTSRNEFL